MTREDWLEERLKGAVEDLRTCARWMAQYGKQTDVDFALGRANAYELPMPQALKTPTAFEVSVDAQYAYLTAEGKPGWVQVKLETEGFVVDIFDQLEEVQASCAADFGDLAAAG